jgi:hypothetical protein
MSERTFQRHHPKAPTAPAADTPAERPESPPETVTETGRAEHPDPTRYGDWEIGGRCIDF